MAADFRYQFCQPEGPVADFVESIGMFHNPSDNPKEAVLLPDGRIDLFFMRSGLGFFQPLLIGLETAAEQRIIPAKILAYTISFKPLAVEYILQTPIAGFLNSAIGLPDDFWGFRDEDLKDFDTFHKWAIQKISDRLPVEMDERKRRLFNLIYTSKGELSVKELSKSVSWSSRQINRYFAAQLGLSLKSYCDILRFRTSLEHICQGKLFPELNFADQSHFIKKIRKFSGVVPKELSKNENDRFILLSVLKQQ
ncbi:AraC family transcriptional regulator [Pedobacter sp. JY14-1]|uniref:helix-turn-helix domain-containing protein n=1 Tax=Pedobacter sp. JY14-1 TaxID=3034151 RepID=UPI0023E29C43|nr:AraC family transcriptional regulator [Pedobacter sp. JY14-1]